MSGTCAGYDTSAPDDVLEVIRSHIRKDKKDKGAKSRWASRRYLDAEGSCLVWDLNEKDPGFKGCGEDDCCMSRSSKKTQGHTPDDEIG